MAVDGRTTTAIRQQRWRRRSLLRPERAQPVCRARARIGAVRWTTAARDTCIERYLPERNHWSSAGTALTASAPPTGSVALPPRQAGERGILRIASLCFPRRCEQSLSVEGKRSKMASIRNRRLCPRLSLSLESTFFVLVASQRTSAIDGAQGRCAPLRTSTWGPHRAPPRSGLGQHEEMGDPAASSKASLASLSPGPHSHDQHNPPHSSPRPFEAVPNLAGPFLPSTFPTFDLSFLIGCTAPLNSPFTSTTPRSRRHGRWSRR